MPDKKNQIPPPSLSHHHKAHVLLLDDNPVDNYIHEQSLAIHQPFNFSVFQNGDLALQHLLQTNIRYDYILVDIFMPLMDGFTFIEKYNTLNLNKAHGQVFIVSISLNPHDRVKAANLNLQFLEKPISVYQLFPGTD